MRYRTTILTTGKTAAGIEVPPDVLAGLGTSRKPPVRVTIGGYTYRSTVATVDGRFMIGVSAENRAKAGVAGGDEVDVDIELDTEPRTVEVPADFAVALAAEPTGLLQWTVEQPGVVLRGRNRGREDRRDPSAPDGQRDGPPPGGPRPALTRAHNCRVSMVGVSRSEVPSRRPQRVAEDRSPGRQAGCR